MSAIQRFYFRSNDHYRQLLRFGPDVCCILLYRPGLNLQTRMLVVILVSVGISPVSSPTLSAGQMNPSVCVLSGSNPVDGVAPFVFRMSHPSVVGVRVRLTCRVKVWMVVGDGGWGWWLGMVIGDGGWGWWLVVVAAHSQPLDH